MQKQRNYKNRPEDNFAQLARSRGYRVTKRGWPDFLCFKDDGTICAVEVKPRRNGDLVPLKSPQADCMDFLSDAGVKCFVSDGITVERYDRAKHRPDARRRDWS